MIGEQLRHEEDIPQEITAQEEVPQEAVVPQETGAPKAEAKEAPFNKEEACTGVEEAVDALYARFGDKVPDSMQEMGEEVRDTIDAIKRNSKVSSREQVVEDLNFKKGNISEAAYNFIVENIG